MSSKEPSRPIAPQGGCRGLKSFQMAGGGFTERLYRSRIAVRRPPAQQRHQDEHTEPGGGPP